MIAVPPSDPSPKRSTVGRRRAHSRWLSSSRPKSGDDARHLGDGPLVAAPEGTTTAVSASNGGHSREISKAPPRGVSPRMTTRTREYLWYETTRATKTSLHVDRNAVAGPAGRNEPEGCPPEGDWIHRCCSRITPPKGRGAWLQTRRQTGYLPGGGR
jgi:hypothetical protein